MTQEIDELKFGEDFGLPEVFYEPLNEPMKEEVLKPYFYERYNQQNPLIRIYQYIVAIWSVPAR